MPAIEFDGRFYEPLEGESILDLLLRNGHAIPHSCKSGVCGSCLLQATAGEPPADAQRGIKDTWKAQGYFLSCVCKPSHDMSVSQGSSSARVPAAIHSVDRLSEDVLRVRLVSVAEALDHRAGQYLTLLREDGLARPYSIASLPSDGYLELHVRLLPGGQMSGWLGSVAAAGQRMELLGPSGDCFYLEGQPDCPMLLVGTGTGLAPLYGIVRDALDKGHRGPIHLFHGALRSGGLYLADELARLQREHAQFQYTPSVYETDGAIDQAILHRYPKLNGWRGYVCGDPSLVQMLKKKLFLAGMSSRDIHADSFLPSA